MDCDLFGYTELFCGKMPCLGALGLCEGWDTVLTSWNFH